MKNEKFRKFLPLIFLVVVAAILIPILYINYLPADEAKKVESIEANISELNDKELSFDDQKAVDNLLKEYSELSDKAKKRIEYSTIQTISDSLNEKMVAETIEAINQIGTVTLDSKDKIQAAKLCYDKLGKNIKAKVTNYSLLQNAETTYSDMSISNVVNIINQIGTVTLKSNDAISQAKTAYYALDENDRFEVSNAETLTAAQTKYNKLQQEKQAQEAAAKKAAQQAAISKLKTETDKVEGITWYKSGNQPYYADSRSYVLPYIGKNDGNTWLRLQYHYTGNEWIFFSSVTIVADGEKYYRTFDYGDVSRDNDTEVWEWADTQADSNDITMLNAIADSKETIIRFQGDDYYYDLTVKSSDKQAIKDVLLAYDVLRSE